MVRPVNLRETELTGLRGKVANLVESGFFVNFIIAIIIGNAVILGLETSDSITAKAHNVLIWLDHLALGIFTIELLLKLFAYRLSFFRAGWNVFDFLIVGIALVPASGELAVLRTLRILRVLRLVSVVPSMRRVIAALLHAIPGMASIMSVLLIIFYVASVLSTKLFGDDFEMLFGTIGASMFTLFQIMTLEGWSDGVVRPVMEVYPYSWIFFIPFIIVTSFAVLNLFIGIIVDAMNIIHEGEQAEKDKKEKKPKRKSTEEQLSDIQKELDEIKTLLKK